MATVVNVRLMKTASRAYVWMETVLLLVDHNVMKPILAPTR
jgi:hypothetical protein